MDIENRMHGIWIPEWNNAIIPTEAKTLTTTEKPG